MYHQHTNAVNLPKTAMRPVMQKQKFCLHLFIYQKGISISRGTIRLWQIRHVLSVSWCRWHVSVLTTMKVVSLLQLHQKYFGAQCLVFAVLFRLFFLSSSFDTRFNFSYFAFCFRRCMGVFILFI